MVRNEEVISAILDNWGLEEGMDVLDVACGTGVLIPDYFLRGAAAVTGIDISPKMAEIARKKFPQACIITGDVEDHPFAVQFDAVMVYNAFPNFPDPERLIERLAALTRPGGRLSVAHGMSRERLVGHHSGTEFPIALFIAGAFTNAVPGIILHIIVIPYIVMAMERAKLTLN